MFIMMKGLPTRGFELSSGVQSRQKHSTEKTGGEDELTANSFPTRAMKKSLVERQHSSYLIYGHL